MPRIKFVKKPASKSPAPPTIPNQNSTATEDKNSTTGRITDDQAVGEQLINMMASASITASVVDGDGDVAMGGGSSSDVVRPSQAKVKSEKPKHWRGWALLDDGQERPKALYDEEPEEYIIVDSGDGTDKPRIDKRRNTRGSKKQALAQNTTPTQASNKSQSSIKVEKASGPGNLAGMSNNGDSGHSKSGRAKTSAKKPSIQTAREVASQNDTDTFNLQTHTPNSKTDASTSKMDNSNSKVDTSNSEMADTEKEAFRLKVDIYKKGLLGDINKDKALARKEHALAHKDDALTYEDGADDDDDDDTVETVSSADNNTDLNTQLRLRQELGPCGTTATML